MIGTSTFLLVLSFVLSAAAQDTVGRDSSLRSVATGWDGIEPTDEPTEAEITACVEGAHAKFREATADPVSALRDSVEELSACERLARERYSSLIDKVGFARSAHDSALMKLDSLRLAADDSGPALEEARQQLADHKAAAGDGHEPCLVDIYYEGQIAELEAQQGSGAEGSPEYVAAEQEAERTEAAYTLASDARSVAQKLSTAITDEIWSTKELICSLESYRDSIDCATECREIAHGLRFAPSVHFLPSGRE